MNKGDEQLAVRSSMRRRRFWLWIILPILVVILVIGAVIAFFAFPTFHIANPAASTSSSSTAAGWRVIPGPNPGGSQNGLNAVAAISANDIWAVGTFSRSNNSNGSQALIAHWNGKQWSSVPSPNSQLALNILNGVAAVSPDSVWAVGYDTDSSPSPGTFPAGTHTLIEHWNGSQWSIVPSPDPGLTLDILNGVTAVSSNDVWAIGYFSSSPINPNTPASIHALIEHWNGTQWSVVPSPGTGTIQNMLNAVAAISASDIWAAGAFCCIDNQPGAQPLIEHWNGARWSIIQSPNPGWPQSILNGLAALSADDIWAVGASYRSSMYPDLTLAEHWDGTKWSIIPTPNNATANNNGLAGVTAIATSDVWAVGYSPNTYPVQGQTLIEHWNGKQWNIVGSPSPAQTSNNYLISVTHIPHSSTVWSVGYEGYNSDEGYSNYPFTPVQALIEVRGL